MHLTNEDAISVARLILVKCHINVLRSHEVKSGSRRKFSSYVFCWNRFGSSAGKVYGVGDELKSVSYLILRG